MKKECPTLYSIEIKDNLCEGDYVELKMGNTIIAQYKYDLDDKSVIKKYKLYPCTIIRDIKNELNS